MRVCANTCHDFFKKTSFGSLWIFGAKSKMVRCSTVTNGDHWRSSWGRPLMVADFYLRAFHAGTFVWHKFTPVWACFGLGSRLPLLKEACQNQMFWQGSLELSVLALSGLLLLPATKWTKHKAAKQLTTISMEAPSTAKGFIPIRLTRYGLGDPETLSSSCGEQLNQSWEHESHRTYHIFKTSPAHLKPFDIDIDCEACEPSSWIFRILSVGLTFSHLVKALSQKAPPDLGLWERSGIILYTITRFDKRHFSCLIWS